MKTFKQFNEDKLLLEQKNIDIKKLAQEDEKDRKNGDDNDEDIKQQNSLDKKDQVNDTLQAFADEYMDEYNGDKYDEDDLNKWLDDNEAIKKAKENEKTRDDIEDIIDDIKEYIKNEFKGLDESYVVEGYKLKNLVALHAFCSFPITTMIVVHSKRKKMKRMAAGLKSKIENEKDPEKKERYQHTYDNMMKACFKDNGKPRPWPKLDEIPKEDRESFEDDLKKMKNDKKLKKEGKKYLKDNKGLDEFDPKKDRRYIVKKEREKEKARQEKEDKEKEKARQEKVEPEKEKARQEKEDKEKEKARQEKVEPEKDKNGNILKQEKIKDPKTGKKIKVTTHTGPRGGKFYWPEGSPKDAEHKVYVESTKIKSLADYIQETLS